MKNKLLLILGISFCLVVMLAVETALMGSVLWLAGIRTSSEPADLSGLPYLIGALVIIALVFWLSRGATTTGLPIDMTPQIIHLGHSRKNCDDVIMHMAGKAEQRGFGKQTGAPIVLVRPSGFDPAKLDYDAALNYQWLLDHPNNGVTIK